MVCDNCFITHTPENCIIDGSDSDEGTNLVDIVSLSDGEGSEGGIISLTNDDEYAGLHTIAETPGSAPGASQSHPRRPETVNPQPRRLFHPTPHKEYRCSRS